MELFRKKTGPVFVKESSDSQEFIRKMEALREKADDAVRQKIDQQIKYAKYGEAGEKNIAFELKHSGMDMLILHDLHLEIDDLSAQIDYMVITRKIIYVIECKNLYGNIKIDNRGAFIRQLGGGKEKGMYSPITQNERHLKVIKALRMKEKGALRKKVFEKSFDNIYRSIVVLANPQTVLYDRYAPKSIKEKVIRYDQLIEYIRKTNEANDMLAWSASEMKELADFFVSKIVPVQSDYSKKFQDMIEKTGVNDAGTVDVEEELPAGKETMDQESMAEESMEKEAVEEKSVVENSMTEKSAEKECPERNNAKRPDHDVLTKKLKEYRLQQSRQNNLKPYYIFNDATMNDLLQKMPATKEELLMVSGFGPAKAEKYGEDILNILNSVE